MKFLVDENLSPSVAVYLRSLGYDGTEASLVVLDRLHEKGILKKENLLRTLVIATPTRIRSIEKEETSIN